MAGVWYETKAGRGRPPGGPRTSSPTGGYEAVAVSPLGVGAGSNPPDICLIYATPGQMIILINGLQFSGYRKYDFTCRGRERVRRFLGAAP